MEQNMSPKAEKFMHYEKLFLRFQLIVFGASLFLFLFLVAVANFFIEIGQSINDLLAIVVWAGFIYPVIQLIISSIRIIKYVFVVRHEEGNTSIWRSALSFLFSPLIFGISYASFFILLIASCAANA